MKIVPNSGHAVDKPAAGGEQPAVAKAGGAAAAVLGTANAELESRVLGPAREALAVLPEIDQAKVDALREALARGEIGFDAERLARLIQRFHGAGQ
ncbi:MAG: flagellar biosynthesis anti-sigma factor FlgM [Roseateles sp.]|uniref:flagellar biosynthesis anti-sigma factor FlgM n=1 Tax=Roseateles sp. TaxID=1971397 RepID=UPI0039E83252